MAGSIATKLGVRLDVQCVQLDQVAMHIQQIIGGVHLHDGTCARARVQMHSSVSYLGNSWTDCAETWCAVRRKLASRFTQVRCWVHLHVRTCVPAFRISETAGRIALKHKTDEKWANDVHEEERSRFVTCDSSRHTRSTRS